ncbi:MAG: hypothetical protein N2234_00055 [Planctomycetota bacterium]|nr:hypothetical protein [Planctomycetota bacterium]
MRAIVLAVVGGAVAVLSALLYSRFSVIERNESKAVSSADKEHLERIEKTLNEIQRRLQRLETLSATLEDAVLRPPDFSPPKSSTSSSSLSTPSPSSSSNPPEKKAVPATAEASETERLRQLIREELKRSKEEEMKRWREQSRIEQPEEWEKQEFGEYAWYVRQRGKELNLTDAQKRQYYAIIKDYYDRSRTLWEELRKNNPNSDWRKLGELYQERSSELLKTTRELVLRILDSEQQKKYREMFEDNEWYR